MGRNRSNHPPDNEPTHDDIVFAAGYYEGEGHATQSPYLYVIIGQNRRQTLDTLRNVFGGKVYGPYANPGSTNNPNHHFYWQVGHQRALDFLELILPYMRDDHRKNQIVEALECNKARDKWGPLINPFSAKELRKYQRLTGEML